MAMVRGGGGEHFMLVTAVADGSIQYIQDDGKRTTATKDEFIKIWSGVALMAEKGEASGEKNYAANKRKENIAALKLPAIVLFGLLILVAAAFAFYKSSAVVTIIGYTFLLLLHFAGIAVTLLLLWYEIDKANPALQKICTAGAKANCSAILGSKEAKLFSWLSWSEVGFLYFASSFILLLIAGFTHSASLLSLVVVLNLFALPYTVFSMYYQWRVAKQWCVLCLCVQALLLLQFVAVLSTGLLYAAFAAAPSLNAVLLFGAVITIVAGCWFLVKPLLLEGEEAEQTRHELQRLKANPQIWEALLAKQKRLTHDTDGLGITLGNPNAANTLIKVCNPYCGPCAKAHPEIEKLLEATDNLKVQVIFTATNDEGDKKALPVKHLLAIAEKQNEQLTKQALDDWYLADKKDYNLFAAKYPMNGELKQQDAKVEAMHAWCNETKIAFTPTIFINGYQLPEVYNIADLPYLIQ